MYTMKEPISFAKFKSYPKDIQKEYLQWFVDEFGASRGMIAQIFERTSQAIYPYFRDAGLLGILQKMPTGDGLKRFNEWLSQHRPEAEKKAAPVEEPKKEKAKVVEQPMFFNTITVCEMSMEGKASEIGQMLFNLFRDQTIAVNISFVGVKESVIEDAKVD